MLSNTLGVSSLEQLSTSIPLLQNESVAALRRCKSLSNKNWTLVGMFETSKQQDSPMTSYNEIFELFWIDDGKPHKISIKFKKSNSNYLPGMINDCVYYL